MKRCKHCGERCKNKAQYCSSCGSDEFITTLKKKKTWKSIANILCAILFFPFWILWKGIKWAIESEANDGLRAIVVALCGIALLSLIGFTLFYSIRYCFDTGMDFKKYDETTYKESCYEIKYDELIRNANSYRGENLTYTGKVTQVIEPPRFFQRVILRINLGGSDQIYCVVYMPYKAKRILEGDQITIWGDCRGLYNYSTIFNQRIAVPKIFIRYFSIN